MKYGVDEIRCRYTCKLKPRRLKFNMDSEMPATLHRCTTDFFRPMEEATVRKPEKDL